MACFCFQPSSKKKEKERDAGRGDVNIGPALNVKYSVNTTCWWGQRPRHNPSWSNPSDPGDTGGSISESRDACASKISVKCVYMWVCIVLCFSSLILFLTPFGPLFDVQIVGCQPGLAVVSKLEVSKLISGSINEILSVWDDRLFNRLSQRRKHGAHKAPDSKTPFTWGSTRSLTVGLWKCALL